MTNRAWKALGIVLAVMLVSSIAVVAQPGDPQPNPSLWQEEGAVRMKFAYDPSDGTGIYVNRINPDEPERALRVYGDGEKTAAFPYETFDGPFNLKSAEAPEKDFVVHNPAFFDHESATSSELPFYLRARGDAYQKTHLRTWYTPCYWEPLGMTSPVVPDYKMDCYPAVVNEYTYIMLDDNDLNPTSAPKNQLRMIFPMAYTTQGQNLQVGLEGYDINRDDIDEIMLVENIVPVDQDTTQGEIWVRPQSPLPGGNLDLAQNDVMEFFDYEIELLNYNLAEGWARFAVRYVGRGCGENTAMGTPVTLQLPGVCQAPGCYLGDTALVPARSGQPQVGDYDDIEAQVQAVTHPFWFQLTELKAPTPGGDPVRVTVVPRRVLTTGETFYVDGAEYDVAALYVLADPNNMGPELKYITIRQPLNKDETSTICTQSGGCPNDSACPPNAIDIPVISVRKSTFPASYGLPVLPPFNMDHDRVDDVNIPELGSGPDVQFPDNVAGEAANCPGTLKGTWGTISGFVWGCESGIHEAFNTILERVVRDQDPLSFWWVLEEKEPRFDTSLLEEKFTEPEEDWQWINIETMPWHFTSLYLPQVDDAPAGVGFFGDYILVSSFMTEDSSELWPGEGSVRVKFAYDPWPTGTGGVTDADRIHHSDIYVNDAGHNNFWTDGSINANSLRVYGRGEKNAAFPYETFSGPFDLTSPEAPPKDFVVFNPAFIDHLDYGDLGNYIKSGSPVQLDANEKVHLRMWYTPKYLEPAGDTYPTVSNPKSNYGEYGKGTIVMEYTYIMLQDATNNIMPGTAGNVQMVFPMAYASSDGSNNQPGLEGYDVNRDGSTNEIMVVENIVPVDEDTTLGEIWVRPQQVAPTGRGMDLDVGDSVQFLDYEVELVSFSFLGDSATFNVYYVGNDRIEDPAERYSLGQVTLSIYGQNAALFNRFDRLARGTRAEIEGQLEAVTAPFWITLESVWSNGVVVMPHRVLRAGESFFVDGLEYDVAAIYILNTADGPAFKYITIRNPLDKCGGDIWLNDISVNKVCVCSEEPLPVLPPFNAPFGRLDLVDDTDIPNLGSGPDVQYPDNVVDETCVTYGAVSRIDCDYNTIEKRVVTYDKDLEIQWFREEKEIRFDTNLLEEKFTEPEQEWMWINIETLPWDFTEFVLPNVPNATEDLAPDYQGDYILVSSWLTEDSDIEVPDPPDPPECHAPDIITNTITASPMQQLLGDSITFSVNTAGTEPLTYEWDFGDGNVVEGEGLDEVEHTYTTNGTFDVTLTLSNECSDETDTATVRVRVFDCDPVEITEFDAPEWRYWGQTATFAATVTGDAPFTYMWDFGDGTDPVSGDATEEYMFAAIGTYLVELEVTGACLGLTDSADALIEIKQFPGDVNGDCTVNVLDVQAIAGEWFSRDTDDDWDPIYDMNGDGVVNVLDVQFVVNRMNTSCP